MIAKTPAEIEKMRVAGRITGQILHEMKGRVTPGVTPIELDELAERRCRELGAIPAFKGYRGFPASVCVSVNDEVVHTIPNKRPFQPGDLIKIDFGVCVDGFFGDAADTVFIPPIAEEHLKLYAAIGHALDSAILSLYEGNKLNRVGYTIEAIAKRNGLSVIRNLCGHGIGKALHEDPPVLNYGEKNDLRVREGMTFAIEPILTLGNGEIEVQPDGWTIKTRDGSYAAHTEHTILITNDKPEVLTYGP